MSIQTQIDRIEQNVADTYSALEEKGATMPAEQNSDNLPATARTVPAGGTTGLSVQADWNQTDETAADFIKNKPIVIEGGDTLTWDGDITGREYVEIGDGTLFVHVSDATPTISDFASGGAISMCESGENVTILFSSEEMMETQGALIATNGLFGIIAGDGTEVDGIVFPKKGVYFGYVPSVIRISGITINGYSDFISETLAPDYLPQIPADKLKEITAVNLNADSDKYLYKSGADTSDTNNRLTMRELLKFFADGRIVYVSSNATQYILAVGATFLNGVGKLQTTGGLFHTAEYTPET